MPEYGKQAKVDVGNKRGKAMATAKLMTGEMVELPNEELYEMIMDDSDKLDAFQSETPRQPRRSAVLY
jgi:hypothetical protein